MATEYMDITPQNPPRLSRTPLLYKHTLDPARSGKVSGESRSLPESGRIKKAYASAGFPDEPAPPGTEDFTKL